MTESNSSFKMKSTLLTQHSVITRPAVGEARPPLLPRLPNGSVCMSLNVLAFSCP